MLMMKFFAQALADELEFFYPLTRDPTFLSKQLPPFLELLDCKSKFISVELSF